jgi:hypothetical protein
LLLRISVSGGHAVLVHRVQVLLGHAAMGAAPQTYTFAGHFLHLKMEEYYCTDFIKYLFSIPHCSFQISLNLNITVFFLNKIPHSAFLDALRENEE